MVISWSCDWLHKTRDTRKRPEEASSTRLLAVGLPLRHSIQLRFRDTLYLLGNDVSMDDQPSLHPTRLLIPLDIRAYVITILNQTLACTMDLRSHVKQASWNMKGTDVPQLQALFATIATELDTYSDLVAERIAL